jgi:uncharacterized membrane protein
VVLSLRRHHAARGVAVALAAGVFLGCWELLHHWFYAHHQIVDTPTYESYGFAMRHGIVPYRDIPVEYPPGALPVFVAPTYLGDYVTTFGWLMAACGVGCLVFAAVAGARIPALAFIAVSPLLIGSIALSRFDFWPMLFVTAAVAALVHDRHRLGFAALGAAIAVKLFGLVLLPLAIVWTLRRRGVTELARASACGLAVVVAALLPFAILAPGGLWHSLEGQASRPLQIESLAASFLTTFGQPKVVATHGSLNLAGHGTVAVATTALELAVLVALWIAFARGPAERERLLRYAAACICAFIALGKVLSPQFLIWLVPLVPLVRGRRGAAASMLLASALVMTQVFFPARYWEYIFHLHLAWLVLARNLVLVALMGLLSLPARARARSS